jgi:ElaB/YqjD/DUF883 family membrane-anchored ribosome-binding protein
MAFKRHEISDQNSLAADAAETLSGEDAALAGATGPAERSEDLAAISAEIEQIKASIAHIAESTSHYVRRRVAENSTDLISENPVRAALWAAVAGFLVGRLTR